MKYLRKVAEGTTISDPKLDRPVVFMEDNDNKDITIYPEGRKVKCIITNIGSGLDVVKYVFVPCWKSEDIIIDIKADSSGEKTGKISNDANGRDLTIAIDETTNELIIKEIQLSEEEMKDTTYVILIQCQFK